MTIYTSEGCPRCTVLKMKLDKAGIKYDVCQDMDIMKEKGIKSIPVIEFKGEMLSFSKENLDKVIQEAVNEN